MKKPCRTCSGPIRETVNGVCRTCGKDYRSETRSTALFLLDSLPAEDAIFRAWFDPGRYPVVHKRMREAVYKDMPLLARALDRMVVTKSIPINRRKEQT